MDEGLGVDVLDATKHLLRKHQDGFERELPRAEVEEVFKTGPEEVNDHDVVVPLHTVPTNIGETDTSLRPDDIND